MSWKQYGGVNKTDTATKFTIGSIVTDNLVERTQLAGEFKGEGNALITGRLNVGDIITNDINVDNDITINNIATINKLLLGTSNKVIFSNQEGLSINHENPLNELDVLGQENIAKFKSTTDSVSNILAMTNENKGIMCGSTKIDETNYESYITFFNLLCGPFGYEKSLSNPDLIANELICITASGIDSKITPSTPIGTVFLSKINPFESSLLIWT